MYFSEWNPDDQAWVVRCKHGTIVRLCHSLPAAVEAIGEAGEHIDGKQHEFRVMCERLRNRMAMMKQIGYLKYLRAWRQK